MDKLVCLIMVCILMGQHGQAAPAATDDSRLQLTIELRDGSRIVGQPVEDTLSFHSTTLGEVKISWADIRTIEYAGDAETVHLTAKNGDAFAVQLSIDTLKLETGFGKTELPVKLIRAIKVSSPDKSNGLASPATVSEAGLRLSIELRDGSHLVGKELDDSMNFHSTAMGDLKLPWSDIRSIVYPSTSGDTAQLTAKNGDIYEVQVMASTVLLETSFGKKELPLKLIRSIKVSMSGDSEEHLIGWWKLDDGNGTIAKDSSSSQSSHDGNLINGPTWMQDPDRNEMSLQFNGSNQHVALGNIIQGSCPEISIACWVKHRGSGLQTVVGRSIWDNSDGIGLFINGDGTVSFGHYQKDARTKVLVQDDHWHYLVGTMSQSDSNYVYSIYIDGKLDNSTTISMGLTSTTSGWSIGALCDGTWAYQGQIEDVRLYDRALSDAEVEAIYLEQNNDDPSPPAPSSTAHPDEATFNGKIRQGIVGISD